MMGFVKYLMNMVVETTGSMLHETGQAMQRLGLRTAGNHVFEADPFVFIGKTKPFCVQGTHVHHSATLIGDVSVYTHAKIGPNCVLRADKHPITIGLYTEIGENSVLMSGNKSSNGLPPTLVIGTDTTIGPNSVIEPSLISHRVKIGAGSVVSEGCIIYPDAVLKPGTVLPPNHVVAKGSVWEGNPATYVGKANPFM